MIRTTYVPIPNGIRMRRVIETKTDLHNDILDMETQAQRTEDAINEQCLKSRIAIKDIISINILDASGLFIVHKESKK